MDKMPEVMGYIASALVLLAFAVTDMRLLRVIAILSNIAFIAYGVLNSLMPVLALHALLLPINILRLRDLRRGPRASSAIRIEEPPAP
jgi:CRP/FNR family transcriptional regulator, cyclic AMP receptor protein